MTDLRDLSGVELTARAMRAAGRRVWIHGYGHNWLVEPRNIGRGLTFAPAVGWESGRDESLSDEFAATQFSHDSVPGCFLRIPDLTAPDRLHDALDLVREAGLDTHLSDWGDEVKVRLTDPQTNRSWSRYAETRARAVLKALCAAKEGE